MNILAYTIKVNDEGNILLENNRGMFCVTKDNLSWLLESLYYKPDDKTLKVFWNLDWSIAPVLKLLGQKICTKLYRTNRCYYSPYSIFYVPGKVFSIKRADRNGISSIYELQQYFPDIVVEDIGTIEEMGKTLLEALQKMNLEPTKLTSPVAIWEQCIMRHLDLPKIWDMPKEAAEYAWECSGKLWVEAYKLGYFKKVWDWDIVGSFPSVAKDLIDIRHCNWVKSVVIPDGAVYGYVKCIIQINDDVQVSPIIFKDEEGRMSTPTGTWKGFLTLGEILFIYKWEIGKVNIIDGWWCVPKWKPNKPLEHTMNRLLSFKDSDNELVRRLSKRMSVGIYGKFGEEWTDEFGPHFNPCWFAEISTQVRLQVAEFIYRNKLQDSLIHVSTDGVLLDKAIEL